MMRYRNIDPSLLFDIAEIRGRWYDTVYYMRGGKQCKRKLGNMNGERWRKDDAFANTRGAAREFGAACGLSAVIRNGLGDLAHSIGGKRPLHTRLTRRLIEGFGGLDGPRGDRPLLMGMACQHLVGFAWDKHGRTDIHQYGVGSLTYDPIVYKRRVHFRWMDQLALPGWATHMRVSLVVVGISDLVRNGRGEKYRPVSRGLHGASAKVVGDLVPVEVLRQPKHGVEGFSERPDLLFRDQVAAVGDRNSASGFGKLTNHSESGCRGNWSCLGDGYLLSFLAVEGVIVADDGRIVDAKCVGLESVDLARYEVCGTRYVEKALKGERMNSISSHNFPAASSLRLAQDRQYKRQVQDTAARYIT